MNRVPVFHRIIDTLMVACLAIIVFSMILQVFARYFNHAALAWPEELSQLLLVVFSFFGMYRAIGEDQHIRLDVLPIDGRSKLVKSARVAGLIAACLFVIYVGYGGFELASSAWSQPSTAMRLPMGIFYMVMPVACLLSLLAFAARIRLLLKKETSAS